MLVDDFALTFLANGYTTIVLQYALTDGVVVWRAWVICRDDHRKLLTAPTAMFILTIRALPSPLTNYIPRVILHSSHRRGNYRRQSVYNIPPCV